MTNLVLDIPEIKNESVVNESIVEEPVDIIEEAIGLEVPIELIGIGDEPFNAKVDTGAACCSLGAEDIQCSGTRVQFTIGDKTYRATCHSKQNIQTSEGDEERPVISLTCKIKDDVFQNVLFNLNDRSQLKHSVLLGLNLLDKLKTDISPNEKTDNSD
jgi:hypothetical protein